MFKHSWVLITIFSVIFALHGITEAASRVQRDISRIIGGEDATNMDIPYIVSLTNSLGMHVCGGSILNERTVITAAHCFRRVNQPRKVHAGIKSLTSKGVRAEIEAVYLHPQYVMIRDCDIALARLNQPLSFGPSIKPIQLIRAGEQVEDNSLAMVAGWGFIAECGLSTPKLQYASVPIINQDICRKLPYYHRVTENMICAGDLQNGGVDACQFDSGGPLVYNNKLIGIVSWGEGCGRPGNPGVYARVAALRPWVDTILKNNYNEKIN